MYFISFKDMSWKSSTSWLIGIIGIILGPIILVLLFTLLELYKSNFVDGNKTDVQN